MFKQPCTWKYKSNNAGSADMPKRSHFSSSEKVKVLKLRRKEKKLYAEVEKMQDKNEFSSMKEREILAIILPLNIKLQRKNYMCIGVKGHYQENCGISRTFWHHWGLNADPQACQEGALTA